MYANMSYSCNMWALGLAFVCLLTGNSAFYLPGVAPHDYEFDEEVELKVNMLDSIKTQLPYDYYSLQMCRPETVKEAAENLGEILGGDQIETSPFEIRMQKTEACKVLCTKKLSVPQMTLFNSRILDEYRVNYIVDNIPAATAFWLVSEHEDGTETSEKIYQKGYPLGAIVDSGETWLNNHVRLNLYYHEDASAFDGYRIVGFEVEAFSVNHKFDGAGRLTTCDGLNKIVDDSNPFVLRKADGSFDVDGKEVIFTYDVAWISSPIHWASRWDLYLKMTSSEIHWFSIVNSLVVALLLSAMVAIILVRTLHKDLSRYNELEEMTSEEQAEETGWKLIHGEVFRTPERAGLFSIFIGTGCQILAMTLFTLGFACLGFLSPSNRGSLMTACLLLFVCMGFLAGYYSTRTFKMFGLVDWKANTLKTSLFFPGVIFGVFFVLNLFVWGEKSSGAVPFGTLVALLLLWLGISAPLVYLGSYFGFKRDAIKHPLRVNNIPRMVPAEIVWYHAWSIGIRACSLFQISPNAPPVLLLHSRSALSFQHIYS